MGGAPGRRAAILTGERGVGKTTLCLELARGRPGFVGIVSPAIFDDSGAKVGFSALCLETGERWDLGRSDIRLDGPRYGKYSFSAAGFTRALGCLERALRLTDSVVVLDELGPLEMQEDGGFAPALPLLREASRVLVVTRPGLAEAVASLLPGHDARHFSIEGSPHSLIPGKIFRFLSEG